MKKFILFFMASIMLMGCGFKFITDYKVKDLFKDADIQIFVNYKTDLFENSISNGQGEIVMCDSQNYKIIVDKIIANFGKSALEGITYKIKNTSFDDVFNLLEIKKVGDGSFGVVGYTNKCLSLNKFVIINNKKVNCQMVRSGDEILIGLPIILGGY